MKVRHVDLRADEFLSAISGEMSPAELGVYWMMCLLIYSRRGPVNADLDWLRAKFRPSKANKDICGIVERLIATGRVSLEGSQWGVSRCSEEIERALSRVREAAENGRKGGRVASQWRPSDARVASESSPSDAPVSAKNERKQAHAKADPFYSEKLTTNDQRPTINQEDASHPSARDEPQEEADGNRSRRRQATRMVPDWEPSAEGRLFAGGLGLDPDGVIAEFRDYWLAEDGPKAAKRDWEATFRNRCRTLAERRGSNAGQRSGPGGQSTSRIAAALSRVHIAGASEELH